jgi:GNAT superfamily N-acetyltransferase
MNTVQNLSESSIIRFKRRVSGRLEQGFYSKFKGYGLRRDLSEPLKKPLAKIPISIRPLAAKDLGILLPLDGNLADDERKQIRWRLHFHQKVPNGCYVAVDDRSDTPCYMQWLIGFKDNDLLAKFRCFPRITRSEAILEQAYTIPSHRGLGIMSAAMADIAERASDLAARYVLTFVEEKGAASLKACQRAGFHPHLLHKRIQIGYGAVVQNTFTKLTNDNRKRLEAPMS